MYYIILGINLYLCLLCDSSIIPSDTKEGLIVGGNDAKSGQFPFAVALYLRDEFRCSASILSPTTVLTAAHCVKIKGVKQNPNLFHLIANVNRSAPEVKVHFNTITIHPEYDEDYPMNDLAIMKTSSKIPMEGSEIRPIRLASPNYSQPGKNAIALGFGRTSADRYNQPAQILQYGDHEVVNDTRRVCKFIDENKICAKGVSSGLGICFGDSGGPLISKENPPVQMGVASYIIGRCGDSPAIYTKVSGFIKFIKEASKDKLIGFE